MATESKWTPELKEQLIADYKAANPTAENSSEIIKELAEKLEQSPNGVRMVLIQAGVYVKKGDTPAEKTSTKTDAPKRVSKEASIAALRAAIEAAGKTPDDEILDKLTGKAAVYFAGLLA
jgi:transposase-like protein